MRKIEIGSWKEAVEIDGQKQENDVSLLEVLDWVMQHRDPGAVPKGFANAKTYYRILEAFRKARDTGILELEETEYQYLRVPIEKDMPDFTGGNTEGFQALMAFMDAKEE